eukprot:TRINITY_DN64130_c0_g1_i1.p1 TRINITY_DN64130_c0_g1~~TRINITY_DN64130_c0_g1_i1.p1  ORF type:complete len:100 (+),score=0.74 TRINITY_DN64130_c0_g1_i1:37-336(+)
MSAGCVSGHVCKIVSLWLHRCIHTGQRYLFLDLLGSAGVFAPLCMLVLDAALSKVGGTVLTRAHANDITDACDGRGNARLGRHEKAKFVGFGPVVSQSS